MKRFIHLDAVQVSESRQRREFDEGALQELGESISTYGMFHPLVLRIVGDGYVLVAGERRLRAIRDLYALGQDYYYDMEIVPSGMIPYVLLNELDELAAEEAELDENIRREDLTWQERSAAVARLSSLRRRQAVAAGNPEPAVASIAEEVRSSANARDVEETRRDIILADHLNDPEVAGAKTQGDAWKTLKRKENTRRSVELAESVGATFTSRLHRLYNEDSLAWMKEQPPGQYDVILTDPPYGMGADEFGDSGGQAAGAHFYKDDEDTWLKIISGLSYESWRITKEQAHIYIFCDLDKFITLRELMGIVGWKCFRTPLIWHKPTASRAPWPDKGPQRKYECILYAVKGDRLALRMAGDVLSYPSDANLGHPAQKPVALFIDLLSRSVRAGDAILDPFCGTGPVFTAAQEFKCAATGIEMDAAAYGIALKRIQDLGD